MMEPQVQPDLLE
jgi:hypothetical protein